MEKSESKIRAFTQFSLPGVEKSIRAISRQELLKFELLNILDESGIDLLEMRHRTLMTG